MMLAPRRFPETIVRRRQGAGGYNQFGEFVEGTVVETELRASVQPLLLEDSDIAGGAQLQHRLKVYVPEPNALAAAFEDREADRVVVAGIEYVVEETQSWAASHTGATILRAT